MPPLSRAEHGEPQKEENICRPSQFALFFCIWPFPSSRSERAHSRFYNSYGCSDFTLGFSTLTVPALLCCSVLVEVCLKDASPGANQA